MRENINEREEMSKLVQDSTGKPVKVGDRVRFRGQEYTVKGFNVSPHIHNPAMHDFYFEEKQHTTEVATSLSIDLVEGKYNE